MVFYRFYPVNLVNLVYFSRLCPISDKVFCKNISSRRRSEKVHLFTPKSRSYSFISQKGATFYATQ